MFGCALILSSQQEESQEGCVLIFVLCCVDDAAAVCIMFANMVLYWYVHRRLAPTGGCFQTRCSRAQEENVVEELEDEADPGRHRHRHPGRHRSDHLGRHQAQGLTN